MTPRFGLPSADAVLRLDRPSGLEREPGDQEQLHAALPLLLPEHLHGHRERLRQRLLRGPDARLARLWRGKCRCLGFPWFPSPRSAALTPRCRRPPGLCRQRGDLAPHQHRGRPGDLCRSGRDRGTAASASLAAPSAAQAPALTSPPNVPPCVCLIDSCWG